MGGRSTLASDDQLSWAMLTDVTAAVHSFLDPSLAGKSCAT